MDEVTRTISGDGRPPAADTGTLRSWGPFQILEKVGQGGFGEVYRAFDTTLQREVALKLLLPRGDGQPGEESSVLREARQMAKVRHPNVVSVYGVDTHDGRTGLWSDFVQGKTLSALLSSQGPFGPREVAAIGIDVARAVSAVHAAGLLHCDIKPGNVMREVGGRILLMDFGLTLQRDEQGRLAGTPPYIAPELFTTGTPAVASDIYAIGVLLFHLLTGKYPVTGSNIGEILDAHRAGQRRRLLDERPDLPEPFARVIETAIHPDPRQRYSSAGELIAALSQVTGGDTPSAPPPAPSKTGFQRAKILAPLAVALLGIVAYVAPWRGKPAAQIATGGAHATYLKAQDQLDHYYRPHGIEQAIALFEKTIAEDAKFPLAYAGLARARFLQYWQLGDPKYIEPTLSAATTALSLDRNLTSVHVTLGRLYTETGKNDLASQELNEALRLDANNAEAFHGLAELYQRQGRNDEVEPALRKAADLAPDDWRFPDALGSFLSKRGQFEKALTLHLQAVSITPDNARALNNLGAAYSRLGRFAEAQQTIEKAIRIEPGFNRYNNLGTILQNQGKYAEATEAYRKAIELNSSSYMAWGNLGLAHARIPGHERESRQAYDQAIALAGTLRRQKPNDGPLLSTLALYYAAIGDDAKSLPLTRQAAALSPTDPEVLLRIVLVHELAHRRHDAIEWSLKALQNGLAPVTLSRYPELSALRSDPDFMKLAQKYVR